MTVMRENGVVMLVWEAEGPALPAGGGAAGEARIAAFYSHLLDEAAAFADRLYEAARAEYAASAAPRKRFTFPHYRLTLTATVTEESEAFFSVRREARLVRGGKTLATRQAADLFWRHTGRLCSPFLLRLRGYRPPRGRGDLYAENGTLHRLPDGHKKTRPAP